MSMDARIGYTNDGKVFLILTTDMQQGQPAQVTFMWTPAAAERIAEDIVKAASDAKKYVPQNITPKGFG